MYDCIYIYIYAVIYMYIYTETREGGLELIKEIQ